MRMCRSTPLTTRHDSEPVTEVLAELDERLGSGQRVFLGQDVFDVLPATEAFYGEDYLAYLADFRAGLCEPRAVNEEPGLRLRELTCVSLAKDRP